MSGWPSVEYPDIYEYLINTPVKVLHSQRLNEEPLSPWVAAKMDGQSYVDIVMVWQGRFGESCSQIVALLSKIEAAVRLGYTSVACTSRSCEWNNEFVAEIQDARKEASPLIPKLPKPLRSYYSLDTDDIEFIIKSMYEEKVTKDDIAFIEHATLGQSDSVAWRQVRSYSINCVLHTNQERPSESLILKICLTSILIPVPSIIWGKKNEENAIREFSCQLERKHEVVVISKSGIRLPNRFPVLGASSDAIGKCVCHGEFLIEVICPHSHRDKKTLKNVLLTKIFA
eukprot:gene7379-13120_t